MGAIYSQKIRIDKTPLPFETDKLSTSLDSYKLFKAIFEYDRNDLEAYECFYSLFLNQSNKVISIQKISEGTATNTSVSVAKVAQGALMANAVAAVFCHNHPSGSLRPSNPDIEITKKLKDGLKTIDVVVHDHIIISAEGYYSFADEGLFF